MSVNRAANRVHVEGAQRRRRNRNFSQQKVLLIEKNHKIPFPKKFPIFKTDECRTLAESVASLDFIGDFIAFFFKTAYRHPADFRSLQKMGDSGTRADALQKKSGGSGNRDNDEWGNGATLARLSLPAPNYVPVSDKRTENGGVMAGVKRRRQSPLKFCPRQGRVFILPGVCGKLPRTGRPGFFPVVATFRSLRPINSPERRNFAGGMERRQGRNAAVAEPVAWGLGAGQSCGLRSVRWP